MAVNYEAVGTGRGARQASAVLLPESEPLYLNLCSVGPSPVYTGKSVPPESPATCKVNATGETVGRSHVGAGVWLQRRWKSRLMG